MVLIRAICAFVSTGTTDEILVCQNAYASGGELRRVCIEILSWLKSRQKLPNMRARRIDSFGSVSGVILKLVSENDYFARTFSISNGELTLNPNIDGERVKKLLTFSAENYDPPRFVTKRATLSA